MSGVPPRVVPLKAALILSTCLWVVGLVLHAGMGKAVVRVPIASIPLRLLALVAFGAVVGPVAGWLDWRWNRSPYYSQLKGRYFNQTGYMFAVAGIIAGAVAGGLNWMEITEDGYEGAFGGAIFGGIAGIVLGIIYRLAVFILRLGK